jgi:hypothetical protein
LSVVNLAALDSIGCCATLTSVTGLTLQRLYVKPEDPRARAANE